MVAEANKYLSDQAPWKLKDDEDKPRMGTVLHVALQVVSDAQHAAHAVPAALRAEGARAARRQGVHAPMPAIVEVDDLDGGPAYPVLTGDYTGRRRAGSRSRWSAGTPLAAPKPVFRKLDPSVVEEELARLAG